MYNKVIQAALATGADAIHPGYGFLSENPELASICDRRNVTFIGPSTELIRKMGDKIQARALYGEPFEFKPKFKMILKLVKN